MVRKAKEKGVAYSVNDIEYIKRYFVHLAAENRKKRWTKRVKKKEWRIA